MWLAAYFGLIVCVVVPMECVMECVKNNLIIFRAAHFQVQCSELRSIRDYVCDRIPDSDTCATSKAEHQIKCPKMECPKFQDTDIDLRALDLPESA